MKKRIVPKCQAGFIQVATTKRKHLLEEKGPEIGKNDLLGMSREIGKSAFLGRSREIGKSALWTQAERLKTSAMQAQAEREKKSALLGTSCVCQSEKTSSITKNILWSVEKGEQS